MLRGPINSTSKLLGSKYRTVHAIGKDRPEGIIEEVPEPDLEELDLDVVEAEEGWKSDKEEEGLEMAGPSRAPEQTQQAALAPAEAGSQTSKRKRDDGDDDEHETIEIARAGKRRATMEEDRLKYFDLLDPEPDEMLLD